MNQIANTTDTSKIVGWGVDANRDNDPTYPMRDRSADDHMSPARQDPPAQVANVEVLQSIEYNRRPAVVGTSTPPSGISGITRRGAFRYSESDWRHWLMLLGADRINMVEGIVQDLGRGKVPNIPGEMGVRAEWAHNKAGFAKKVAVAAVAGALIYGLSRRGKPRADRLEGPRT